MRKNTVKNNSGITLIALVVTIIVLLILAGVSIAMLTGENGILKQARTAKEQTISSQEDDQAKLAYASALTKNEGQPVQQSDLEDELDELVGENLTSVSINNGMYEVTFTQTHNVHIAGPIPSPSSP